MIPSLELVRVRGSIRKETSAEPTQSSEACKFSTLSGVGAREKMEGRIGVCVNGSLVGLNGSWFSAGTEGTGQKTDLGLEKSWGLCLIG